MRLFGFTIGKSRRPALKVAGTSFESRSARASQEVTHELMNTVQAVSEPGFPGGRGRINERQIPSDPLGDWYLNLPDKLEPKQVSQILRQALAGNLWQQSQLTQRMRDSWPMFRKCEYELRSAVSSVKFVVHPYAAPDQDPTPEAQAKADLVRRALENFKPDRFSDEEGNGGMIFDLCDAVVNGISVVELLWDKQARDDAGHPEHTIRAATYVQPRHISFRADGTIGIDAAEPESLLQFPGQSRNPRPQKNDPRKFLVAKFKSKSGSCLGAGFMRVLAYYWCTIVYGRDFMLSFAQKYGNPFLDIAYQAGISTQEIDRFEALARKAMNNGFCVHPNSGTIAVTPGQTMSGDNANVQLMKIADEACQMLMLGQTLTSSVSKDGGSRALGEVHGDVRREKIEGIVDWVATILTEQFAESLLIENYRESSERPRIEADLTRPLSAAEKGALLQQMSNSTVPLPMEQAYKLIDFPVPQAGDKVLVRGAHQILEEALTPTEARQQQFDEQVSQQQVAQQVLGEPDQTQPDNVEARLAASGANLDELEAMVTAAEAAPRLNGQWTAIQARINPKKVARL